MSDMCGHSKANGAFVQVLGCGTASNATTVLPAGVFGNERLPFDRTVWIHLSNTSSETSYVFFVKLRTTKSSLVPSGRPLWCVGFTLTFSTLKGTVFDKETLEFVDDYGDPFGFDTLHFVETVDESKALNSRKGPMIIVSASGMCEFGRVVHHLRNTLESVNNTVAIVGFQAQHTLGRRLVERRPRVKIFGVKRDVRAKVEVLNGFYGTSLRQTDLRAYAAPQLLRRLYALDPDPQSLQGLALLMRLCKVVRDRFDVLVTADNEADLGRR